MDSLDYACFDVKYSGVGHPAYHPRVLLKLLVMGVLDRVRSSRRLARNARENVVYMFLAEKLAPDFRTISDFRKNNPDIVKEVFKHTVTLARQEGMLDLSCLATDGSKIKACAADKKILSRKEIEFLLRFVDEELEGWGRQDEVEDEAYGNLRGSDELPGKSRKKIQSVVKNYVKKYVEKGNVFKEHVVHQLETARKELEEHDLGKVSLTDPESRFMPCKKSGIRLSYNSQVTVDGKGFILAADVCKDANDVKQLQPQISQTMANTGPPFHDSKWCFDNGYFEGENLGFLQDQDIDGYIPGQEKKTQNPYDKDNFKYLLDKDEYICPTGQAVKFLRETFDKPRNKKLRVYECQTCKTCSQQKNCTKTRKGLRQIKSYPFEAERYAMNRKMKTLHAQKTYKLRSQTVEPAFGDLKENKNMRKFITRSLETVKTEFRLACTAANLKKIWKTRQNKEKPDKHTTKKTPLLKIIQTITNPN